MRFILAVSDDNKIALRGGLPWRIPNDFKWFKMNTFGESIIMGRKTWDSIGRKALPGRKNIVLSRTRVPGVTNMRSLWEIESYVDTYPTTWVIGGAQLCEQLWKKGDILLLTRVHVEVPNGLSIDLPDLKCVWSKKFDSYTFSINIIQ